MLRKKLILTSLIFLFSSVLFAAPADIQQLKKQVNVLCSKPFAGRLTGSPGDKLATQYVADQFHSLGLQSAGDDGSFFQDFYFTDAKKIKRQQSRNVLARLTIANQASKVIVIGAHVDHLGYGKSHQMYPGADDNASGVASMLLIAKTLTAMKANNQLHGNKNIIFAAWSGEEVGILGSTYFVNKVTPSNIVAMINLDMVGHLREKLIIQGTGSSADWPALLDQVNAQHHAISLIKQPDPYLPTDSTAFYLQGVPALNFFTGSHDNYHDPRDKPDTLNYAGIEQISAFVTHLVLALEEQSSVIHYQAIEKNVKQYTRKIYLGTVPDYSGATATGVKLAGVIKNSPAELAGMRRGDIVIEVAGEKINDIYDYTNALNRLSAGKRVQITVRRGYDRIFVIAVAKIYGS
jgi:hypothetical protein